LLALAACSAGASSRRDWNAQPAFVVQKDTAARTWVVSDVHGGPERLVALLQGQGLLDAQGAWSGGGARLYVLGDLIDKAHGGLDTLRLLRGLQGPARRAGGEVVVTMGNHEAEFLADPLGDKTVVFQDDLSVAHLDPSDVGGGADVGAWLRGLPFGILDGGWFFSHAGNTSGRSLEAMAASFQSDVDLHGFAAGSLASSASLLEATLWWETADPAGTVDAMLAALPARHLVFGHDPSALGKRGSIGHLLDGRMFLVDAGMSPAVNDSQGALMSIERGPAGTTVSVAFASGPPAVIYQE
jgi:hypothetical protein